jgi:hypothetical protein
MIDLSGLISFLVFCGLSKIAHVHFCLFNYTFFQDYHGMGYAFVKVNGVMASLALEM